MTAHAEELERSYYQLMALSKQAGSVFVLRVIPSASRIPMSGLKIKSGLQTGSQRTGVSCITRTVCNFTRIGEPCRILPPRQA